MGIMKYAKNLQRMQDYQVQPNNFSEDAETKQASDRRHLDAELVTVCIVAVLVTVLLLALLFVWIIVRRRNSRKRLIAAKYSNLFTTMKSTPFYIVRMTRQLSEPSQQSNTTLSTVNFAIEKPQFQHADSLKSSIENGRISNTDKMAKYHSFDTNSRDNNDNKNVLERSKSLAALPTSSLEPEMNVSMSYTLKYIKDMRQLQLKLQSVTDLPVKCFGINIYVIVYLFPRHKEGIRSRNVIGSKETELQETFLFDDMTLQEVERATIRMVLQYKKKSKSNKECWLGETYLKCCDVDWIGDQSVKFESLLNTSRNKNGTRRKGTPGKYPSEDLGSVFVCLEYQAATKRMKVMARKAANLPKSDQLFGRPGHYVVITLLRSGKAIKTLETKVQTGYNPVWYQPFLFEVSGNDINDYSLELVIMRRKIYSKDTVVGHVTIGQNGCQSGRFHWKDIISPKPVETTKWHLILPMLKSSQTNNEE